jgi:hypothetical protein
MTSAEPDIKIGSAAYAAGASAFAWAPGVFCAFAMIAGSHHQPGKSSAWGIATIVLFALSMLCLVVATAIVLASGRPRRWFFAALNLIPLGPGLWWLALALLFGGGIFK